jgi:hypothetical protein
MISSLNRMLSRMDTLVADRRFLGSEVGVDLGSVQPDMSYVSLQLPVSDLSFAYEMNSNMELHNYSILCADKPYPIDRFFAMLLFEPIRIKEMGGIGTKRIGGVETTEMDGVEATEMGGIAKTTMGGSDTIEMGGVETTDMSGVETTDAVSGGPLNHFDMRDVTHEELGYLIAISFVGRKVELRKCDLVRLALIADQYLFWKPVRFFLWFSLCNGISRDLVDIRREVDLAQTEFTRVHQGEMLKVLPSRALPKRYAFSVDAVRDVAVGCFYGDYNDDFHATVLCVGTVGTASGAGGSASNVYVLTWPRRSLRTVPMHGLHALLDFDTVRARVGYPVFGDVVEGRSLSMLDSSELSLCIGLFYVYRPLFTEGRTYTVVASDYTFAFVLGLSSTGAYVLLRSGVVHVGLNDLHVIEHGHGAADPGACARADLILNARPRPVDGIFGDRKCEALVDLEIGTYYHCPSSALYGDDIGRDPRYSRTGVLYLGPASGTKVYVYGHKREVQVDFQYLRLRDVDEVSSDDERPRQPPGMPGMRDRN